MTGQKRDKTKKLRLDLLLVDRGLAESREKGQAIIFAGQVLVNGQKQDKAGAVVPEDAEIRILGETLRYVGRGGLKLEAALREFRVPLNGKTALDVGASTGGFTDCLLQHGVQKVFAVDVGYGQLAWKLRQDPRVVVIERVNIRAMAPSLIPEPVDIAVIDVSFISLTKVIPSILNFLKPDAAMVALIKPQFEVGPGRLGKGGRVKLQAAREAAVAAVLEWLAAQGWTVRASAESPVRGGDGAVEHLAWAVKAPG